jgi:hypothetical protein
MLLLIAVILVLPQVDLPDSLFQRGTAPIIARARAVSLSAFGVVRDDALRTPVRTVRVNVSESSPTPAHPVNQSLSILFSMLLC